MAFQPTAVLLWLVIFYQYSSSSCHDFSGEEPVHVSVQSSGQALHEGTRQSLNCTVDTVDPFDFGLISVSWLKNGGPFITNGSRVTVRNPSMESSTIKFDPLRTSDGGRYQCVATVLRNGATVNFTVEVIINVIISEYIFSILEFYPSFLRLGFQCHHVQ